MCRLFTFGHQLWAAPLQTCVAVGGLCMLVGYAALAGVAVVLVSMWCTQELTKRAGPGVFNILGGRRGETSIGGRQDTRTHKHTPHTSGEAPPAAHGRDRSV